MFSPDRYWWWDGWCWQPTVSPDGAWQFDGKSWQPITHRPRWFTVSGVVWLLVSSAWLVAAAIVVAVDGTRSPSRPAGAVIGGLGAMAVVSTVAWGFLVGRRSATRWLWKAAAVGTAVQMAGYITAMLAAPSPSGDDNDTAAGAGVAILLLPTAVLVLTLLWTGAGFGLLWARINSGRR